MLTHEWHGGGNVFIRPNIVAEAGHVCEGHTHNYAHLTLFWSGWRADATLPDGTVVTRDFPAGSYGLIRADVCHKFTALPHEMTGHETELLDAVTAVADGAAPVETLAPAVALYRRRHREQPHHFWCMYAHRNAQGDVVQEYNGWPASYT